MNSLGTLFRKHEYTEITGKMQLLGYKVNFSEG